MPRLRCAPQVCSGHGDWIVERAKADPDSNWIALEMRYERVFQIYAKTVLEDVDNVLIIGGEAHAVFRECLRDAHFAEVFVNYPDPPVWHGSSQSLGARLLADLPHDGGDARRLTLCVSGSSLPAGDPPDAQRRRRRGHHGHGRSGAKHGRADPLAHRLPMSELRAHHGESVRAAWGAVSLRAALGRKLHHEVGAGLGRACGGDLTSATHSLPSDYGSSFFDRFWSNGERTQRFMLRFRRESAPLAS